MNTTVTDGKSSVIVKKTGMFRWAICALLFFACTVNYMDRQVLGLLKPSLAQKFSWSETDYSRMAILFQAAYAIGQVLFGPIINWIGTKKAYAFSVLLWSSAAMSHAFCRTVGGFSVARFALGLGESGNFPTAIRVVTEWFPPKERSVATGIFNTGSNIGAIFAPVIVPLIVAYFGGWQAAFVTLACADLIWLGFWLVLYNSPEKSTRVGSDELAHIHSGAAPVPAEKISWLSLLRYRQAWAYYGTCVLVGPVWWFYGFWLPDFFNRKFHLDLRQFGPPLVAIYTVTALGSIGGGGLSAWLLKRGWSLNWARKSSTLLFACCTLPVIFAPRVESVWLAAAFFGLAAASHQGWSATMYTVVSDIFPKPAVASVVGFGGTLASVMSMAFFYFVGHVLQGDGSYKDIMLMCGSAYVVAWLIFHLGVPQIKPASIK
ncbi:MAG TPA: MFS transporter [Verrucomicrobiae bacterium]|jgi:ACS family hexuronate transporter-like MFS transporter|nr:MFS transporter [Verrucomicrobiae bacterium]